MVSLRLSEDEFQELVELSARQGANSTSDLARIAICDYLNRHNGAARQRPAGPDLMAKIVGLQGEVRRLSRLLDNRPVEAGGGSRN